MKIFNVILECRADEKTGYFISFDVAAPSKDDAANLALSEHKQPASVDEIALTSEDESIDESAVLKVYGRSYFPIAE